MKRFGSLSLLALTGTLMSCGVGPIDLTGPTLTLSASSKTVNTGTTVTFMANANDPSGVNRVEFYKGATLLATDTSAPYTTSATYTAADNGTQTITAKAYDNGSNVSMASETVAVNISTAKPAASVTASASTLISTGSVIFTATASDDIGVTKVEFYDNGKLIATDTAAPYSASTAYAFADNGAHTIMIKAYDADGNVGEASATVTVAIADRNEPNDSVAAATALTVGTPVQGAVAAQGRDYDYFKFTAKAGDPLKLTVKSVSVDAKSTLDPYVMILMPDGKTVLEKDDDGGSAMESEIRFNAPVDGTYTVVLTSFKIHNDSAATDDLPTNTYELLLGRR